MACVDCTDFVRFLRGLFEIQDSSYGYHKILTGSPPPTCLLDESSVPQAQECYEWHIPPASECGVSVGDNSEDWDVVNGDV